MLCLGAVALPPILSWLSRAWLRSLASALRSLDGLYLKLCRWPAPSVACSSAGIYLRFTHAPLRGELNASDERQTSVEGPRGPGMVPWAWDAAELGCWFRRGLVGGAGCRYSVSQAREGGKGCWSITGPDRKTRRRS